MRERLAEQTGQALVILALGFVVMVAFVGLAADTMLVIVSQARLVRAVDAGSLAAASIYREGATVGEMKAMAVEFVSLNGADAASTQLATCEGDDPLGWYTGNLCPGPNKLRRKVLVRAEMAVDLAFLRILRFRSVTLSAESTAEAASLDIVLAIDTSESMANQTADLDSDGLPDPPQQCNPSDRCFPFREVKDRAREFVELFRPPFDRIAFDRIALVTFDQKPLLHLPLTVNLSAVNSVINSLNVYRPQPCFSFPPDPSPCTSTNIGGALWVAQEELANSARTRDGAVWVLVLLTDGAANTTCRNVPDGSGGVTMECPQAPKPHQWPNVHCPPSTWLQPFCRDGDSSAATRHSSSDLARYDADDWARDMADFVAGNEVVIFTIGMGDLVVNFTAGGDRYAGEELLRNIAAVGDDGDPKTDPCAGVPNSTINPPQPQPCGNYFFSPGAEDLRGIFSEIAERILTRLIR